MVLPSAPLPRFPGFGERQQSRPLLSYRESGPAQDEPRGPQLSEHIEGRLVAGTEMLLKLKCRNLRG